MFPFIKYPMEMFPGKKCEVRPESTRSILNCTPHVQQLILFRIANMKVRIVNLASRLKVSDENLNV